MEYNLVCESRKFSCGISLAKRCENSTPCWRSWGFKESHRFLESGEKDCEVGLENHDKAQREMEIQGKSDSG